MSLNTKNYVFIRTLMILFFAYAWLSVNIYLPALPLLPKIFHTTPDSLKLSITLFFAGYAVSQLFWGPMSEKHGRRSMILIGMIITTIGVFIAMMAQNVVVFNVGRLVEALGLGCASVLGRAVLVDLLDKMQMFRTMSYATLTVNIMPAIAPIIGGSLLLWFGWRSIFGLLLIYSIILLLLFVYRLMESNPRIRKEIQVKEMIKDYGIVAARKRFLAYVLLYVLGTGGMIGYYAMAPFIFTKYLGLSAHTYGYYGLITVASYLIGALVSNIVTPKLGISRTLLIGVCCLLLTAILILLDAFYLPFTVATVIAPMAFYTFAVGTMAANANAGAMVQSAGYSGAGSALLMFAMYAGSAIFSAIATGMPQTHLLPLAIYISAIALMATVIYFSVLYSQSCLSKTP